MSPPDAMLNGVVEVMTEDKTQVVSFRMPDEIYLKLKDIAAAHGESVGDTARRMVEKAVTGEPSPAPSPSPAPDPAIPDEIAELRKLYVHLVEHEEEMRQYVNALGGRMNDVQGVVTRFWTMVWPMLQTPPWGMFGVLPQLSAPKKSEADTGEVP